MNVQQKHDRDLKADKLQVLRHKVKTVYNRILDKSNDDVNAPKLKLNDLAMIEDELRPEFDTFNSLIKSFEIIRENSLKLKEEKNGLVKITEKLKIDLNGKGNFRNFFELIDFD